MKATTRRKLEMAKRALEFSQAHPDSSAGYSAAVTSLTERLKRADQVAEQQRDGILEVRAATARKRELRRMITRAQLDHLTRAAWSRRRPVDSRRRWAELGACAFRDPGASRAVECDQVRQRSHRGK